MNGILFLRSSLRKLEQSHPSATEAEQIAYLADETTPSFKCRVVGDFRGSSKAAIDKFVLENKYFKVAKAAVKG